MSTQSTRPSQEITWRPVAVIDIGSTAIRMTIAQVDSTGRITPLESLKQSVALGRDTFTKGRIERPTIEEAVRALNSFRLALREYGITSDDQIRAVATTAVCEAENRIAFFDRVYIATGIRVSPVDEVDATRLTFLSIRSLLKSHASLTKGSVVIAEMGGGSTELVYLNQGKVLLSQVYRLGSLRLRETLEGFRSPVVTQRDLMENQIETTVSLIRKSMSTTGTSTLLAVGGDARLAATELVPGWEEEGYARLPVQKLGELTERILKLSVNDIVRTFNVGFPDAETLGPALLFYYRLARSVRAGTLRVADVSMRQGLLLELSRHNLFDPEYHDLIIQSAREICKKYLADEAHSVHVSELAATMFRALNDEHHLGPWHETLLKVGAILHDIGTFVSPRNHHKHSMYLVRNSNIFGLNRRDQLIVSLLARYHRRSSPKPTHSEYRIMDRDHRVEILKMAAILRVADALDRSASQRVRNITCSRENDRFVITVPNIEDLTLEQLALQNKGPMFQDVYGMPVVLRTQRRTRI